MVSGEQYRFGRFQLDVAERELRRDGELVALTAKTFDLLLILVRGAGRTLTKAELLDSLWPGVVSRRVTCRKPSFSCGRL